MHNIPPAMHYRFCGIFTYRLSGLRKGDVHPAYTPVRRITSVTFTVIVDCILCQGDFEMEDLQARNNSESVPMMGQPVTVQPGRESDDSQPVVLQPRSSNGSPSKQMSGTEGAV